MVLIKGGSHDGDDKKHDRSFAWRSFLFTRFFSYFNFVVIGVVYRIFKPRYLTFCIIFYYFPL
jgi:hypothetical protein